MMKGLHHMHMRKRASRNFEPFPASTFWKRALDRTVLAAGIIGPMMALPQIAKIYTLQDATSVSSLFWGMCALLNIPWILYGLVHKERPIFVTYTMWFLMNITTFVSSLYFGAGFF